MIICARTLTRGRTAPRSLDPVLRERMRLSRQAFDRGLVGDFRPAGGPRRVLPLVGGGA